MSDQPVPPPDPAQPQPGSGQPPQPGPPQPGPPQPGPPQPQTGGFGGPAQPPPPGGFGGPAQPPPPPPGGFGGPPPPPGGPAGPGGPVGADIGAAWSWAWSRFGKYAAAFVGLAAVVFAIRFVGAVVNRALTAAFVGDCVDSVTIGNESIEVSGDCSAGLAATIAAGAITAIVFGVLAWIATIGVYRAALKSTRGEVPSFSHLTTGENLGRYVLVAIVYGLLIGVGLVLCILPGIAAAFLFQLAPFYALDKGQGVGEALGNSFRVTTQNFVPALLMTLVNVAAVIVGGILFGVLTLVALPFAALFTAHMYRQFNREPIAP